MNAGETKEDAYKNEDQKIEKYIDRATTNEEIIHIEAVSVDALVGPIPDIMDRAAKGRQLSGNDRNGRQ